MKFNEIIFICLKKYQTENSFIYVKKIINKQLNKF